jgi:hypothetical protein
VDSTPTDAGNGKSPDFRLSQDLANPASQKGAIRNFILWDFRPLFRLGGRWCRGIPSETPREGLLMLSRKSQPDWRYRMSKADRREVLRSVARRKRYFDVVKCPRFL